MIELETKLINHEQDNKSQKEDLQKMIVSAKDQQKPAPNHVSS